MDFLARSAHHSQPADNSTTPKISSNMTWNELFWIKILCLTEHYLLFPAYIFIQTLTESSDDKLVADSKESVTLLFCSRWRDNFQQTE